MALEKSTSYTGQESLATLGGEIRVDEGRARITVSNGTNNLALLGYDDHGDVVVKVAKPGYNANSASDENLIFNSQQNIFKIIDSNSVVLSLPASPNGTYSVPIPHTSTGIPGIIAYFKEPGGDWLPLPYMALVLGSPNSVPSYAFYSVNSTDITFKITTNNAFAGGDYTFKYYVLQETAA